MEIALLVILSLIGMGSIIWLVRQWQKQKRNKDNNIVWKSVFDILPLPCMLVNTDFKILEINNKLEKSLNLDKGETVGKEFHLLFSDPDNELIELENLLLSLEDNKTVIEEVVKPKGNGKIIFRMNLIPVMNENGLLRQILITLDDISQRTGQSQVISDLQNQLNDSREAQQQFINKISQSIKTPLNSILGFASLMLESDLSDTDKLEYRNQINLNSNRLMNLVNDLADLNRLDIHDIQINLSEVNLNEMMNEIKEIMEHKKQILQKNHLLIFVENELPDQQAVILTDPYRVRQALFSLLDNSIQYTSKGFIQYGYRTVDKNSFMFYVRDSGLGIPEDKQEALKNYLKLSKNDHTQQLAGEGLGLTLAHRLVHLLEGKIWFESAPGKGTTFYFTIPAKRF